MKFRFAIYLLAFCCALPAAACADGEHGRKEGGKGSGNNDTDCRPYSEKMFVKRQGDDLYISAKMDRSTDIVYWFKRCMFNELYTFYRVGIIGNNDAVPTNKPETQPGVVLNLAYSDNIGPFAVAGCGWCGANHKYMERTARTAYNEGYAVFVDGNRIDGDLAITAGQVEIEVENAILDPSRPYRNAAGEEELRDVLCRESVRYRINRNNIEVAASHRFCNPTPVTIAIYYGMQSMFEGETHLFTPAGAYGDWTPAADVSTFNKGQYPLFRRYLEKNTKAYQSTFLLPDGLGDHSRLGDNDIVFINASYGKSYHKLIADKSMKEGDKINWRGIYTWFVSPLADDTELLCYEGIADGRTAIFIDCKKACKRDLKLPSYLDARKCEVLDSYGRVQVTADGRHTLKISADAAGGSVLLLKK